MLASLRAKLLLVLGLVLLSVAVTSPIPGAHAAATSSFAFNWAGKPQAPQAWTPNDVNDWDLIVHSRDRDTFDQLDATQAQHGPNCEPYPATHTVTSYGDAVFICNNHMMTALNAGGYGQITFTPARLVDFSSATARITFKVSTFDSALSRDWFNVTLSPFDENLVLPAFDGIAPDLQGVPAHAIEVHFLPDQTFEAHYVDNFHETQLPKNDSTPLSALLPISAVTRSMFELDVSRTHIRFGLPGAGVWWVDTDMPALPFGQGVIQFGHQSYDPTKAPGGVGNTWHWSDVAISSTVPFTMLRGTPNRIHSAGTHTVTFPRAAPANAYLRFVALAKLGSVNVSYDGGKSFSSARVQTQCGSGCSGINDGLAVNYWTPVPAGATSAIFAATDWWGGEWRLDAPAIWSLDASSSAPPDNGNTGPPAGSGTTGPPVGDGTTAPAAGNSTTRPPGGPRARGTEGNQPGAPSQTTTGGSGPAGGSTSSGGTSSSAHDGALQAQQPPPKLTARLSQAMTALTAGPTGIVALALLGLLVVLIWILVLGPRAKDPDGGPTAGS